MFGQALNVRNILFLITTIPTVNDTKVSGILSWTKLHDFKNIKRTSILQRAVDVT